MMYILVTYDVSTIDAAGRRRLRKVARCCVDHGQRVQNSVFECLIPEALFVGFRDKLIKLINPELDSLRIYRLGRNYATKIEHYGAKRTFDLEGDLII